MTGMLGLVHAWSGRLTIEVIVVLTMNSTSQSEWRGNEIDSSLPPKMTSLGVDNRLK